MTMENPARPSHEAEPVQRKQFIDAHQKIFSWPSVGEYNFEQTANNALSPEREHAVSELNVDWAEMMADPDDTSRVGEYLEAARARDLIPDEFLTEVEIFAMRHPSKIQGMEGIRYLFTNSADREEASEIDWDVATTLVLRAEQMMTSANSADAAITRMRGIISSPMRPTQKCWTVANVDVLDARQSVLQQRDRGYDPSIGDLLQNYAAYLSEFSNVDSKNPFALYELYERVSLSLSIEEWERLNAIPGYTSIHQHFTAFLAPQQDIYLRNMAEKCIRFMVFQYVQRALPITPSETYVNTQLAEGMTFADLENPFEPIVHTITQGVPWIGCTERRHHFVVPSARLVRSKKKNA